MNRGVLDDKRGTIWNLFSSRDFGGCGLWLYMSPPILQEHIVRQAQSSKGLGLSLGPTHIKLLYSVSASLAKENGRNHVSGYPWISTRTGVLSVAF